MRKYLNRILLFITYMVEKHKVQKLCVNNQYLEEGEYSFYYLGRSYLVKEGVPIEFLWRIGVKEIPFVLKTIHVKKNSEKTSGFAAQILMTTASGVRYFDYKRNLVYKEFNNIQESVTYRNAISAFTPYFQNACISVTDNYVLEKIVKTEPRSDWGVNGLMSNFCKVGYLYENYLSTLCENDKTNKSFVNILQRSIYPAEVSRLSSILVSSIDTSKQYLFIPCHGDLHFGNTLFEKGIVYLIDFDEFRKEVFFYDIFNMIYVDFVDVNSTSLIDAYLSEDQCAMSLFDGLFSAVGLNFEREKKLDYVRYYMYRRLIHDIDDALNNHKGRTKDYLIKTRCNKVKKLYDYIKGKEY